MFGGLGNLSYLCIRKPTNVNFHSGNSNFCNMADDRRGKFNKTEDQLDTMFDKWLFVLRNLSRLLERPVALQERVFEKLFRQAEIAKFTPEERQDYEESVKIYRDLKNSMDTAVWKEDKEIARRMKADGMGVDQIAKYTGLPLDEIEVL